jgi:hypothetical protein
VAFALDTMDLKSMSFSFGTSLNLQLGEHTDL